MNDTIDSVSEVTSNTDFSVIFAGTSCFLTAILILVTYLSVRYAINAYKHQKERAKKDAACDLAKYFAQQSKRHQLIMYVFNHSGLESKIEKWFPYDDLKKFDYNELISILKKNKFPLDDVIGEMVNINPISIYKGRINEATSIEERRLLASEYINKENTTPDDPSQAIKHKDLLTHDFFNEIVLMLNDLEWFSMTCRYGLADEEILYQSLHQTFLSQIWLLYFYIASENKNNEDKLFTNIIWLFCHWKSRLRDMQVEAESNRIAANEEIRRYEELAEKAKAKDSEETPGVYTGTALD